MRLLPALLLVMGCATTRGTPVAHEPSGAPKDPLAWAELNAETLARARKERRFVVMDGAAEWCHWCHVMEATTYHDPAVQALLRDRFIAVKVDIDTRPDIQDRYSDYGWPATVIFSPDAEEIGKYRGYIPPDRFVEILRDVVASGDQQKVAQKSEPPPARALSEDALWWMQRFAEVELEEYWDAKTDAAAKERLVFVLDKQKGVMDPVWGGVYQYSTDNDWDHPHFEKLMPYQAGAIDNYASAYMLTKDARHLETARSVQRYVEGFLLSKEGGFYATQDADLNAHERGKRYMHGHEYYAKPDAERRALGIPRVDTHEYARENGLAIAAYATLYEATKDAAVLATANKAADRILATHETSKGGVAHDADREAKVLFLADNAAFAYGLVRLYEVTKEPERLRQAQKIAAAVLKEMEDPRGGGFFESSVDPDAVGVFATRKKPFEHNVMMIRVLARLGADYKKSIAHALFAIGTPEMIKSRGRMIGDFILALQETRDQR
jgi:uncharacterized protein